MKLKKFLPVGMIVIYIITVVLIPLLALGAKGTTGNTIAKVIVLGVFTAYYLSVSARTRYWNKGSILVILLYVVSQTLVILTSSARPYVTVLTEIVIMGIVLFCIPKINVSKENVKSALWVYLVFIVISIVYNLIKHWRRFVTLQFLRYAYYDMYSFFDNKNTFGMFLFTGLVAAFYIMSVTERKKERKWAVATAVVIIIGIVLSMCRTALLGMGIFLLGMSFTLPLKQRNVLLILVALAAAIVLTVPSLRNYIFSILLRMDVSTNRDVINRGAIRLISEKPIFGYGDSTWAQQLHEYGGNVYSHNGYLSILLNGGLLYFTGYLIILGKAVANAVYLYRYRKDYGIITLSAILGFAVYAMFEPVVLCGANAASMSFTLVCLMIPLFLYGIDETEDSEAVPETDNAQVSVGQETA